MKGGLINKVLVSSSIALLLLPPLSADQPEERSVKGVTVHRRYKAIRPLATSGKARTALPKFRQLNDHATALLRAEKKARSTEDAILQTIRIAEFAQQLSADPRFEKSPTLQQTRGRLHARLRAIKQRTIAQQRKTKRRPEKIEKIEVKREVLAQLNQAVNAMGNQNANANQNFPPDYGPLLVELIQRTISPNSWDVNGGPSTIRYWRPGMALVVRAPQDLHHEVAPLLLQLRQQ